MELRYKMHHKSEVPIFEWVGNWNTKQFAGKQESEIQMSKQQK